MFGSLGFYEILFIILFILLFFGSKKLPGLMQGLGKGIKQFRNALRNVEKPVPPVITKEVKE